MNFLNDDWKEQIGKEKILWSGKIDDSCLIFYSIFGGIALFVIIAIVLVLLSLKIGFSFSGLFLY